MIKRAPQCETAAPVRMPEDDCISERFSAASPPFHPTRSPWGLHTYLPWTCWTVHPQPQPKNL